MNFYNENDPKAAAWLRELIKAGQLPQGHVDERSILEIKSDELKPYTQCHFFAGIGGWPLALHFAGWPEDKPAWTGSCPCQPFSDAGKGLGEADPRHLWPTWFRLIEQRNPTVIFGEQVASKSAFGWLDGVFSDLEKTAYACAAADLCAAGLGAPHIRQRIFWAAYANSHSHGFQTVSDEKAICFSPSNGRSVRRFSEVGSPSFRVEPCPAGARPMEVGNGVPGEVDMLRGFGNAVVPQLAAAFVISCEEAVSDHARPCVSMNDPAFQ